MHSLDYQQARTPHCFWNCCAGYEVRCGSIQEGPSCIFDLYAFGGILLHSGCWTFFFFFLLSSCDTEKKHEKLSLPLCIPANRGIRQKGHRHKCTTHCAMGRDASTLVMQRGGGEGSGIYTVNIFTLKGQAQLLSSSLDWKIITSLVFRARGNPSVLLPLDCIASSCWCRDMNFFFLTF